MMLFELDFKWIELEFSKRRYEFRKLYIGIGKLRSLARQAVEWLDLRMEWLTRVTCLYTKNILKDTMKNLSFWSWSPLMHWVLVDAECLDNLDESRLDRRSSAVSRYTCRLMYCADLFVWLFENCLWWKWKITRLSYLAGGTTLYGGNTYVQINEIQSYLQPFFTRWKICWLDVSAAAKILYLFFN